MTIKTRTLALLACNLLLLAVAGYLFQVDNPSELVRAARVYILGVNIFFLLVNWRLYRRAG